MPGIHYAIRGGQPFATPPGWEPYLDDIFCANIEDIELEVLVTKKDYMADATAVPPILEDYQAAKFNLNGIQVKYKEVCLEEKPPCLEPANELLEGGERSAIVEYEVIAYDGSTMLTDKISSCHKDCIDSGGDGVSVGGILNDFIGENYDLNADVEIKLITVLIEDGGLLKLKEAIEKFCTLDAEKLKLTFKYRCFEVVDKPCVDAAWYADECDADIEVFMIGDKAFSPDDLKFGSQDARDDASVSTSSKWNTPEDIIDQITNTDWGSMAGEIASLGASLLSNPWQFFGFGGAELKLNKVCALANIIDCLENTTPEKLTECTEEVLGSNPEDLFDYLKRHGKPQSFWTRFRQIYSPLTSTAAPGGLGANSQGALLVARKRDSYNKLIEDVLSQVAYDILSCACPEKKDELEVALLGGE